jgi:hypothetical protein
VTLLGDDWLYSASRFKCPGPFLALYSAAAEVGSVCGESGVPGRGPRHTDLCSRGAGTLTTGGKLVAENRTDASNASGTAVEGGNSTAHLVSKHYDGGHHRKKEKRQ